MPRHAGRNPADDRRCHPHDQRRHQGKIGCGFCPRPQCGDRQCGEAGLRGARDNPSLSGHRALRWRPIQALHLSQIFRCAAGVRGGIRHRLFRRRSRQFQFPALRPRFLIPQTLRKRQAGGDARTSHVERVRAQGRRARLRRGQSGRHGSAIDRSRARHVARCDSAHAAYSGLGAARPIHAFCGRRRRTCAHRQSRSVRSRKRSEGATR